MAAETVDTRVVEAKFDSKQFEQGVDRTVKKLDELKKSLNLKDGEKSVAEIGNKISDTSEKASESLEKLEKRFTSFFGMLKQKLVSGIADEIVGSIFKVKNAINGLVSSLSTGQIGYGMQRYTDILTSVRTLTASGVNEGAAYETIERLGEYADQTSYSLDQLVSTMSKFKTAGADLGTAQRMVEGLSNAAASMGVNAQDAARAYLNLQQAYSKGKMTQADWISFESLPMVGEKFNQAIIDAAVKVGTLKQNAKGTYEVVSKAVKAAGGTGGRVSGAAAKGITAENMGSKLASGWFNKQVMEEVFGSTYYFAEVGIDEVNAIKEEERKIRADVKKDIADAKIAEADYDKEVTSRLEEYFKERNKVVIDEKKAEIEARKESAKADLDSRKIVKEEYDKLIKDLDKEMKDFEANNHLSAFAYQAFTAGQEARSFTDVLNTLKDTISRGWATSFELIFGKLDEAKDFFTSLTESQLAEGIYAIGEFRNAVLENWRNSGGRESLLGLLEYMDNIAGSIWKKLGLINDEEKWFNDNFDQQKYNQILKQEGQEQAEAYKEQVRAQASAANPFEQTAKELGQRLSILTRNIQDFFEKVHKWFTEADSTGTSRLQRISNILEGFGTIGRGALYAVGQGLEFIGKVYNTFKTSFDALWRAIDNISQKVFAVFNPDIKTDGFNIFTALADTFENILTILKPLNEPLTKLIGILEDVAGFFVDMGISSVLMNIQFFTDGFALLLEVLGLGSSQQARGAGVLDGIVRDIKDLGESCKSAMTAVGDFFKSLFDDLRVLVGLKEDQNGEKHGIFANIENWFNTNEFIQKVKARIDKAIKDIGDFIKDIPNRITNIGVNIGDFFKGIFYYKTSVTNSGVTWIKKPLTEWIENATNAVWNFVTIDIPKFVKGIPDIVGNFFNSLFYTKQTAKKSANGFYKYADTRTPLKKWLDQAILDAKNFIKSIPEKLKKIPSIIEEFFKSIFYYKTSVANGGVTWVKKPFTQWIDENIVKNLKTFITELPTYIGQAIGTVSNFAGQVVSAIFGKEDGSPVTADDVTEGIRKPFLGANVTGIINSIKGVAKRILSGIASAFTGETDWESNKNWLAEGAGKLLENIKTKAEEVWNSVQGFFATLPEKIEGFFKSSAKETEEGGTIWTAGQSVINGIGKWLSTVPNLLLNAWKSAEALSGGLWNTIIGWITGKGDDKQLNAFNQNIYDQMRNSKSFDTAEMFKESALKQQWRDNNPIAANISDFFVHLGDYFKEKILAIPGQIKGIASNALEVLTAIKHVIFGEIDPEKYENPDHPIYTAVTNVFSGVVKWVTDNAGMLKDEIVKGWNKAVTFANIISEVFFGGGKQAFNQKEYDSILNSKGLNAATRNMEVEIYKNSTTDYGSETRNNIANFFVNVRDWILEEAKNLPKNIAKAWTGIVNFAGEVGPKILEGLNSALEWVRKGFEGVTSWLRNPDNIANDDKKLSLKEMIDNFFDKPENAQFKPLWENIKAVGATIRDFLVETIPSFISAAVSKIAEQVPTLLGGLFDGTIFGNLFGNKKSSPNSNKQIEQNIEESGKTAAEILKTHLNTDFAIPVEKVIENFNKNMGKNGPFIDFEEYARSMGWTYDPNKKPGLFGALADEAEENTSAEEVLQSYEDELKRKEELLRYQTSLSEAEQALLEYPKDSEAYKKAEADIDKYSKLIESFSKTEKKSEKAAEESKDPKSFSDTAMDFVGGFSTLIGSLGDFASSDAGKAVIHILAITFLLDKIKDMFSLSDNIAEIGETVKGVVLSAVFAGLTAMLGYIIYLASMDPGSAKMQAIERIFGYLTEIAKWVSIFAIAWKGGGAIKDFIGLFDKNDSGNAVTKIGTQIVDKSGIGSVFELFTNLEEQVTKPLVISGVGEAVASTVNKVGVALVDVGTAIGQAIDTLMEYIKPTIDKITSVKNDLSDALEAIPLLRSFIEEFLGTFMYEQWRATTARAYTGTNLPDSENAKERLEIVEDYLSENMNLIDSVSTILSHVANGIKSFSSIENAQEKIGELTALISTNDFKNMFTTLFNVIYSVFIPVVDSQNSVETVLPRLSNLGTIVRLISDALSIFGDSVNNISLDSIGAINTVFGLIDQITNNIDKYVGVSNDGKVWTDILFGDTSFGGFGKQVNTFATNMVSAFRSINNIRKIIDYNSDGFITGEDEYTSFVNSIDLINQFAQKMTELKIENIAAQLNDDDKVNKLDTNLPILGHAIMETMFAMNNIQGIEDINFDKIKAGIESFTDIAKIGEFRQNQIDSLPRKILDIKDAIFGEDNQSGLIAELKQAGTGWGREAFGGISEFIEMLGQFSDAVQTFYEKNDEDKYLYEEGLGNIATEMLNILGANNENPDWNLPKITPILELGEFEESAKKMWSMLGINPGEDWASFTPNMTVNMDGIQFPQPIDYTLHLQHIESQVDDLKQETHELGNQMAKIHFVINGQEAALYLGPDFDDWLGENSHSLERIHFK